MESVVGSFPMAAKALGIARGRRGLVLLVVALLLVTSQWLLRGGVGWHLVDLAVAVGFFAAALVYLGRASRDDWAVLALVGGTGWCISGLDARLSACWWPAMAIAVRRGQGARWGWIGWVTAGALAGGAIARAFEDNLLAGMLALVGATTVGADVLGGRRERAEGPGAHWAVSVAGVLAASGVAMSAVLAMFNVEDKLAFAAAVVVSIVLVGCGGALLLAASVDAGADADITDRVIELARRPGSKGLTGVLSHEDSACVPNPYAAGVAMVATNRALVARLEAQVVRSRALQRRLVSAADTQRAELAAQLESSVQPLLDELTATLRLIAAGPRVPAGLGRSLDETGRAKDDLQRIAHGLHPRLLSEGGLRLALADLGDRLPLEVCLSLSDERFAPTLEATVWYVCAEAMTNAVKHAGATRVTVTVERARDHVTASVVDDGCDVVQVADLNAPGGLAGLHDRVSACGGTLDLVCRSEGGLLVVARLPC